ERLRFVYKPIVWGEQSIKTAEAYILAERYGLGEEFADALFSAKFEQGRNISDLGVIIQVGRSVGLGDEWAEALEAGEAKEEAESNIQLAAEYRVRETPTLIVNGRIVVSPHPTGDDVAKMAQNLDRIIQELLS
ncbi:MAG: thioredoxin domain-containing protein, partial [Euryarchaeota archaeon]|nr:thioredoxin domain-containing protein [Euryarchaeota archaeon]